MWPFTKRQQQTETAELKSVKPGYRPRAAGYDDGLSVIAPLTTPQKMAYFGKSIQRNIMDFKAIDEDTGENATVVMDGKVAQSVKTAFRADLSLPEEIYSYYANRGFIGYQACAILAQHEMIAKVCSKPGKDAMAPDYKLKFQNPEGEDLTGDGELGQEDEDMLSDLKRLSASRFDIVQKAREFSANARIFGVSYAVPLVDGINYEAPFNIDGVGKGAYRGMVLIEPFWLTPELNETAINNPMSLHYYEPTYYRTASNVRIHRSHIIKLIYKPVADILKPTYYFGGIPLTQQIFRRVYAAERVADEAPYLAMTKRLLVVDTDMEGLVAGDGDAVERLQALAYYRDNAAVWAKNPEDAVSQVDTTLTDFDALLMTQYTLVASIAEMPSTTLLGTTPKGFNATGEFEHKNYIQLLQDIQEGDYVPFLAKHYQLYTKSKFGREIMLDIYFNPVDQPTEKEKAEVAGLKATETATLVQAQVVDEDEARQRLRSDEDGDWSFLEDRPADFYDEPDLFGEDPDGLGAENSPPAAIKDAKFAEGKHDRDKDGKFTSGGSSEAGSNSKESESRHPKEWGQAYNEFSGKPNEAINKLLSEKQGFVPAAMSKEPIGNIAFVWGDDNGGIKHMLDKHGEEAVRALPEAIKNGEVIKHPDPTKTDRRIIFNRNSEVVISLKYNDQDTAWVVTSYSNITNSRYQRNKKSFQGQDSVAWLQDVLGKSWDVLWQ